MQHIHGASILTTMVISCLHDVRDKIYARRSEHEVISVTYIQQKKKKAHHK